jgi:hypothetical protein
VRRADHKVFRIVAQARSLDGPVDLVGVDGPPFEMATVDGRTFALCFEPEKPGPDIANLARVAFEAYGASTGGKTWDGKPIPPFETIRERTPHVALAWEAAATAILKELHHAR